MTGQQFEDSDLTELLSGLGDPPGPHLGPEARRRAAARHVRPLILAAVAALLLVAVVVDRATAPTLRARGDDGAALTGSLDYVVERGANILRSAPASLELTDRVVFRVRASAEARACVTELLQDQTGAQRVLPTAGDVWLVAPGENLYRVDGRQVGYRTERGSGSRLYRLTLTAPDEDCDGAPPVDELLIRWGASP